MKRSEIRDRNQRFPDCAALHPGYGTRHCERSEAIHWATRRKNGLLRRFAPRNDGSVRMPDHGL